MKKNLDVTVRGAKFQDAQMLTCIEAICFPQEEAAVLYGMICYLNFEVRVACT